MNKFIDFFLSNKLWYRRLTGKTWYHIRFNPLPHFQYWTTSNYSNSDSTKYTLIETEDWSTSGYIDENTSDGYHSYKELYQHRHQLFIAVAYQMPRLAWKSRKHADGRSMEGWFVAGINLPTGDITYHLPNEMWEKIRVKDLEFAPQWDGHTSNDVVKRLEDFNKEYGGAEYKSVWGFVGDGKNVKQEMIVIGEGKKVDE